MVRVILHHCHAAQAQLHASLMPGLVAVDIRVLHSEHVAATVDIMIHSVTALQARALIASGELDIVDVREPSEWAQGHLPGARLVPLGQLRANTRALLPRDRVLFVCAAGVRSQTAANLAAALGLGDLYNLSGGTRGWVAAGLPLVQDGPGAASGTAAEALGLHP
jgi:rhodanese-related sulfurtransferase